MKEKYVEKLQRFGGAMFTPVLLFTFPGLLIGICAIFQNTEIMGTIAEEGTLWTQFWFVVREGAQTVFRQMPLLFVAALPIALAKKQAARAVLESLAVYMTFNYFLSAILTIWGPNFGIDFANSTIDTTGITLIASIKTLDTGILGSLIVSGIVVYLHNNYFEAKLPEWLGVFKGSSFIYVLGFIAMFPLALLFAVVWPKIQIGIEGMQVFFMNSGGIGVFAFTTLSRLLIPTGLHHFVYMPFNYGDAVVQGGLKAYWSIHMNEFAQYKGSLMDVFPEGRFLTLGYAKVFGTPGIAAAFYATAKKENRKKLLSLLIPVTLTAVVAGVTEPIEFTFLFIAPFLFVVHSILAGLLAVVEFSFGVVGGSAGNLIEFALMNWIPLWPNHSGMFIKQIIIGLVFTGIWFSTFTFLILKFNIKTPGREDKEIKLFSKKDYKEKHGLNEKETNLKEDLDSNGEKALAFLKLLGGESNIESVTNCASRLRVTVKNSKIVRDAEEFKKAGAFGFVENGRALQIIVGMDVPIVRERFENLMRE